MVRPRALPVSNVIQLEPPARLPTPVPPYAELIATSNFSFLRGGSHPEELVSAAMNMGLSGLGICDRNSFAGVVRGHVVARNFKDQFPDFRYVVGVRLVFADGTPDIIAYPTDRDAYGRLCQLLTRGNLRGEKGDCRIHFTDLADFADGQLFIFLCDETRFVQSEMMLAALAGLAPGQVWLAANLTFKGHDRARLNRLADLGKRLKVPLLAVNDVLYHEPSRRILHDVVTCIRQGLTLETAGRRLEQNAERHLKPDYEMARLFAEHPEAIAQTQILLGRIGFNLDHLKYNYPEETIGNGETAQETLERLTWAGAAVRYPEGVPDNVKKTLWYELCLIAYKRYASYFLTVADIVNHARYELKMLCQGRGSAANSSVCYCLGVTEVNPVTVKLVFGRFISTERDEPPDIDVDFEHERREEVMQYVYRRYGRHRAAICATVIHYRPRSAIRDVGKALGLTEDITAALANTVWGSWGGEIAQEHIRQVGLDPDNEEIKRAVALGSELLNFPRHLSQHVGGYVLTKRRLDETVPIGNAAMEDRTFIQWDKDDIDALGLMKVDVLALGMLSCMKRSFDLLNLHHADALERDYGRREFTDIAHIPQECPKVYDMLCKADSLGVFQVESRAQMSMLPRLRPREFYDLVIEVAIVRPGPIQGDMVHPYLKRRSGLEPVEYPSPHPDHGPADELKAVLKKTFGVPLFQEQAMRLAIEAAKFSDEEANQLRRAMATFKHLGDLDDHKDRFIGGMVERGYDPAFAMRCFEQIKGFGHYGFPESHAISFALLVYASSWMKRWYPDVFCAAILNSQPMGFYQPAQLVRDARDHGVEVRAVDLMHSDWDCTLEPATDPAARLKAVRLGFREIKGLKKDEMERLVAAREAGAGTLLDLARAARLSRRALELLAEADAFRSLGMDRRAALWAVKGEAAEVAADRDTMLDGLPLFEAPAALPQMTLPQHVAEDYRTTGLSLKAHPCAFYRPMLDKMGCVRAGDLPKLKSGTRVSLGGLVLIRQRPSTAKGVVFVTLEDETGPANAVVWEAVFKANRRVAMSASFMVVHGRIQRDHDGRKEGEVIHIVVERFTDLTAELGRMREEARPTRPSEEVRARLVRSRDFH